MVKVINGPVKEERADAPGKVPDRKPTTMRTTCPACHQFFKKTKDFSFLGSNAEFMMGYVVRDVDQKAYRPYFCHKCKAISASRVHFKRCRYKDEIIEYDTELGNTHYVTCRDPGFVCDKCDTQIAIHKWFCTELDISPPIRFLDVYNDPWFEKMNREWFDEALITDREAMEKWITDNILTKR